MQRSTAAAASLTPRSSSIAGSDLECTVFPPSVKASGPSADSFNMSLRCSASGEPIQEHIHSAASEAQALTEEAAQLKAQAHSYQARHGLSPGCFLSVDPSQEHHGLLSASSCGCQSIMQLPFSEAHVYTGSCKGSGGKEPPGQHPAGACSSQGAGTELSCHGSQSEEGCRGTELAGKKLLHHYMLANLHTLRTGALVQESL